MKLLILLAAATVGAAQAQAQAQSIDAIDAPHVAVYVGDLDQNTDDGLAKLYKRLREATARVCEPLHQYDRLDTAYTKCREGSLERAMAQLPALAGYDARKHKSRNG
jgi:UrcA family protein